MWTSSSEFRIVGKSDRDEKGERSWVRGIQPRRWKAFMQFFRVEGPWYVNQYHFFCIYKSSRSICLDPGAEWLYDSRIRQGKRVRGRAMMMMSVPSDRCPAPQQESHSPRQPRHGASAERQPTTINFNTIPHSIRRIEDAFFVFLVRHHQNGSIFNPAM